LNMYMLLLLPRKLGNKLKPGDNFLIYLIIYPVGRFLLEFIRLEYSPIAGLNINQTIMAVVAVAATIILVLRHLKKKEPSAEAAEEISQKKE
ncbi:MAG: prolipoprotein diacylglyceryl transferase, partial [Ignavibacteria bacterium]|nr:prolipoprotein diacylglyceryl transferase [Ignavibacteria bacterium]